jgi:DNA-binding IclR family transcriptional regulator
VAEVKEAGDKRRGIQSVEIGLRVLSVVAGNRGPSSLSLIAQASGLSVSQTHRYLASLINSGMVKQEGRSSLYDLDFDAIRIGLAALARLDSFALADGVFRDLTQQTRRTCLLAVWGDIGPVVVRWFPGDPAVITSLAIGSTLPLLRSSTGRVFLAFADKALTIDLARKEARQFGRGLRDFEAIRDKVFKDHFAHVEGDLVPGLRATSAPVFDLQGRLVFAATLIANANFDPAEDGDARSSLIAACQSLTEALGGTWF